jgi:hypothetical protein
LVLEYIAPFGSGEDMGWRFSFLQRVHSCFTAG